MWQAGKMRKISITLLRGLLSVVCALIVFSCKNKVGNTTDYTLVASDMKVSFPLSNNVKQSIKTLQYYKNDDGKEYLTFQNDKEPEILFYDMQTSRLVKTLQFSHEGSNNVGSGFVGYYIKSQDEIYLRRRVVYL